MYDVIAAILPYETMNVTLNYVSTRYGPLKCIHYVHTLRTTCTHHNTSQVPNFMAQMGIPGDPKIAAKWDKATIRDDPRNAAVSNKKGFVTFATSGPNTRSSQFFINFKNNAFLDGKGFPPIGRVVESDLAVIDTIYKGYGEGAPQGRGPSQDKILKEGNEYLDRDFPKLTYVARATVKGRPEESLPPAASTTPPSIKRLKAILDAEDKDLLPGASQNTVVVPLFGCVFMIGLVLVARRRMSGGGGKEG